MKFIVVKLRKCYEGLFKKKPPNYINSLSTLGTQLDAIKNVSLLFYISPDSQVLHYVHPKTGKGLLMYATLWVDMENCVCMGIMIKTLKQS